MRVIARKERPHPGAQLTLTDTGGHRVTCFATNDPCPDLPALEVRHRQRARCEDRIKDAKDTGLTNLPYADAASNAIWLQVVLLAMDLTAWAQQLALTGTWRIAQHKTLRLKLFATAARHINAARRRIIDLDPADPTATTQPPTTRRPTETATWADGTNSHAQTGSPRKNKKPTEINKPDDMVGLGHEKGGDRRILLKTS